MSKQKVILEAVIVMFLTFFLCSAPALAANITIQDGNPGSSGTGVGLEDQEAEPGMVQSQVWDLEGFILEGTRLTMVGGFDFADTTPANWNSGDIFIKTGSAPLTSTRTTEGKLLMRNEFLYDYVIDLDFTTSQYTYDVYKINIDTMVESAYYANRGTARLSNQISDPWNFNLSDNDTQTAEHVAYGDLDYKSGLTDAVTGFLGDTSFQTKKYRDNGGTHYSVSVNLDFLDPNTEFYSHFTMECGNDNLMGHGTTPVPEPATMFLFGTGLIGLAGLGRKKLKPKK